MAYALVGTIGTVSAGASGAAVTPAYGTGESRTANNLLVCWVAGSGGTVVPATPAGWSSAASLNGNSLSGAVFYKVAAGADAAPTIALSAGVVWSARLGEFSGGATATPLDKTGTLTSGTGTLTLTASGIDTAIGELVVYAAAAGLNGGTQTMASSGNNWTPTDVNNNATATANHYLFGYGVTTVATVADKNTLTFNATADNATGALASFKLAAAAAAAIPDVTMAPIVGAR